MKTDIEDEETVGLPGAVRRRISRLAKALKWKIYHLLFGFSAQASTLGVFKHASGLGSTNLQIFRFNFPTETTLSITYLLKNSEISTLFGSSPVLRHNNACVRDVLTAPSNVYLNLGFNLFHSYFSLFINHN